MSRSDDQRVADIVEAAQGVRRLVAQGRNRYDADSTVRFAMERLLEIIGEAALPYQMNGSDSIRACPGGDISRFRVVLAHHYHRVDPDQVWTIAQTAVPELLRELDA